MDIGLQYAKSVQIPQSSVSMIYYIRNI